MVETIYYRTFPLSKPGAFPSVTAEAFSNGNGKRSCRMGAIEVGRPAKIPKHEHEEGDDEPWVCPSSIKANRTRKNSAVQEIIGPIVEHIKPGFERSDKKEPISLASADASLGHIPPCAKAMEAIVHSVLRKPHTKSYTHACGAPEARRAIASHHNSRCPAHLRTLSPENVIVTNGCSGALELTLSALLDPGTSILVPQPGFPLYEEIAASQGASVVRYNLDPEQNWECDLDHLRKLLKDSSQRRTIRAMVINNPSSHGAVFSREHLEKILDFCLEHRLPIVSDEVYGDLIFGSNSFHPMATVAASHGRKVPIVTVSGLSKQFLLPGWRLGWVTFHDNTLGSLKDVQAGAKRLAGLQHGVSHLQQSAIPQLLSNQTPGLASWKQRLCQTLAQQAKFLCDRLVACQGLSLKGGPPQGSMYAILGVEMDAFHHSRNSTIIRNDVDFCRELVREENVFCLPGSSFGVPGTIRVAFGASEATLEKACARIARFCSRHATRNPTAAAAAIIPTDEH